MSEEAHSESDLESNLYSEEEEFENEEEDENDDMEEDEDENDGDDEDDSVGKMRGLLLKKICIYGVEVSVCHIVKLKR